MKAKKKKNKSSLLIGITAFVLLVSALATVAYISYIKVISAFPVKKIIFNGNKHLTIDELRALAGIHGKESLIALSGKSVSQRLLKSPWIRSASVSKVFPDTLSIVISEVVPFVLLDVNGHIFLSDDKGNLLEELKDNTIPFLPIITGDPFKEKEGFSEALTLAKTMIDMGFSSERDQIEIVLSKPQELTSVIDGTVVKIGIGEYREKLERLLELQEEIQRRKIPVDYIDLRFANRVVVKPIKEVIN
ncbi:MAG TPA: FtsQ-type POTRA domain-containing protein [Thermodesulfovibrionales bacterium]|nr:FtsQ-type POTRA domain-containing protein [Thermodesulfovibrionales bacterium]